MRTLAARLCTCIVCAALLAGCGSEGKSVCEKAEAVRLAALDEACASRGDDCCMCKCHKQGMDFQEMDGCTCLERSDDPPSCSGEIQEAARACIQDEAACRQRVIDGVEASCPAG